jgi:hypothetical protein
VREVLYQQATPVASRHLEIALSELGHMAGVLGAAHVAIDHTLAPSRIDSVIEWLSPRRSLRRSL